MHPILFDSIIALSNLLGPLAYDSDRRLIIYLSDSTL
jgi:hypothetical protein